MDYVLNIVTANHPTASKYARDLKPGQLAYIAGTNEIVIRTYVGLDKKEFKEFWLVRLKDGDRYNNPDILVIPIDSGVNILLTTG